MRLGGLGAESAAATPLSGFSESVRQRFERLGASSELVPVAEAIEVASRRLDRPLRVAVVGAVSSGKSTLVNALVGQRVGRTDAGETTYVNWRYRYGAEPRAEVRSTGGRVAECDPTVDEVDAEDLDRMAPFPVDVWLPSDTLDGLELIDTPGLFSLNRDNSAVTEVLLGRDPESLEAQVDQAWQHATEAADALLVLTGAIPKSRERELVSGFSGALGNLTTAPTEVLFLFSHADKRMTLEAAAGDGDALEDNATIVDRYRTLLRDQVWDVAPCIPLLGQTAATGDADSAMLDALQEVVADPDWKRRAAARQMFLDAPQPPSAEVRLRLINSLGLYGIAKAASAVDDGRIANVGDLRQHLLVWSGLETVIDLIRTTFAARSEVIRVSQLLADIERLARDPGSQLSPKGRSMLESAVQQVRTPARPNDLSCLFLLRASMDKRNGLREEEVAEIARLVQLDRSPAARLGVDGSRDEIRQEVLKRISRWTARTNATPDYGAALHSVADQNLSTSVIVVYGALLDDLDDAQEITSP